MARYKTILIACPQHGKLVRGAYACDESGSYLLGREGKFMLSLVRCTQDGGRCMATLCALHRYNRGGSGTWFPGHILAAPKRRRPARPPGRPPAPATGSPNAGATDVLC